MGLPDLLKQLNQVVLRYQTNLKQKRLTFVWLSASSLTLSIFLLINPVISSKQQILSLIPMFAIPILIAVGVLLLGSRKRFNPANRHQMATLIEQAYPDLNTSLLVTLELEKTDSVSELNFLQNRLVQQVIAHGKQHDWRQTISDRQLILQSSTQLICFTAWIICCLICWSNLQASPHQQTKLIAVPNIQQKFKVEVVPGTTEVEKSHPLLITARFTGNIPDTASIQIKSCTGERQTLPLMKHLDDPVFATRLPAVMNNCSYTVQASSWKSDTYQVKVFVLPELVQLNTIISPPEYTGQPVQNLEDNLLISAITGSTIEFNARFNKPVKSAILKSDEQRSLPLIISGDGMSAYLKLKADTNQTWSLRLTDVKSRKNRTPPIIDLSVIPNLPPEIKVTFPARDTRVSPLEEALIQGTVTDDFGIQQVGLVYSIPGAKAQTLSLRDTRQLPLEFHAEQLLSLERLQVQPDTLISYYLFAEDIASNGSTRKVLSDMYFMEVRHFEEIFREGRSAGSASQSGKKGGNAQQAEKLAEQQKQIINATWKIIRREIDSTVSDEFVGDVSTLQQAQQSLSAATQNFASKIKSQQSKAIIETILKKMQEIIVQLISAKETRQIKTLTSALTPEQASYQLLLKLRAREHRVSKNKNGGGSKSGGSSRSQNQLQQLELTNKKQRYEPANQASHPKAAQPERDSLQILNRLRELAQRQKDLNEQLKELADKKRFAKTHVEKEEIERQLKRLRDRQRDLLQKADQVAQRMDQSKDVSNTKSRRELEQTRKHLQQSSQSLKQGQISRALNSGTRAQRQLDQLKNDFRKKTANQFAETMRSLNQQAEQLNQEEKALSQSLNQSPQPAQSQQRRSLRKNAGLQKIVKKIKEQESRLKSLVNQMKKVIQESEESEPLLSKHLYDAIRKTRPFRPADSLKNAANFLSDGKTARAQQAESQAAQGIETIKKGVQLATESILGNDLDSLKRARQEIKSLTSEVKQEQKLAQSTTSPNRPPSPTDKSPKTGKQQSADQKTTSNSKSNQLSQSSSSTNKGDSQVQLASAQKKAGEAKGQNLSQSTKNPGQRPSSPKSLKNSRRGSKGNSGGGQATPSGIPNGPITGNQFLKWSDRMRDVEEMVGDPKLRSQVAQIRERAHIMHMEFKRHSKVPEGDLVDAQILEPLVELQSILSNEISKRGAQTSLAPIDRDPVPEKYSDLVRRYYEELGSGK